MLKTLAYNGSKDSFILNGRNRNELLSIYSFVARVITVKDLFKIFDTKLKSLFYIKNYLILRINNDFKNYEPLVYDWPEIKDKQDFDLDVAKRNSFIDLILQLGVYEHLETNANQTDSAFHEFSYFFKENGNKKFLFLPLFARTKKIGILLIQLQEKANVDGHDNIMIKHLASQVSIALSNIITGEDIKQKLDEQTKLLTFTNTLAAATDRKSLARLLKNQLKELFDIDDYIIHAISENQKIHLPILFDLDAVFTQRADFKKWVRSPGDVTDSIFDIVLSSVDPVVFNIGECANRPDCPVYLKIVNELYWQEMIGVAIKIGNRSIAVMNFHHRNYKAINHLCVFFKEVLAQLAVAVLKIILNEEFVNQWNRVTNDGNISAKQDMVLKQSIEISDSFPEMVGTSPEMQNIFQLIAKVASSDSTVLILGETGTGKELIARAIHNNSTRRNRIMVKINCAAIPENLIESELFGHERGSFTGAIERRIGKFELANGGTLFLDEIGEMPLPLQVKLLRALQEREIERIGGGATIKVNVRVIAATNRNLDIEMTEGRFRPDLYYRLNIFRISAPPLRDRSIDIASLVNYFINLISKKTGRHIKTVSRQALEDLMRYDWPGNIRELENSIERTMLLTTGDSIKKFDLPLRKKEHDNGLSKNSFDRKSIFENERDHILKTLKYCGGRIAGKGGASELLAVPATTLNSKMKKLGIRREHVV